MKISLIVPVYKDKENVKKFLDDMQHQTKNNYEIVFIVDTNNQNVLEIISKAKKKVANRTRVIFNSKRIGRTNTIYDGIKEVEGDYTIIISLGNEIEKDFVEKLTIALKKYKEVDILEFRAAFKNPIKYHGKIRKSFSKITDIEKRRIIVAYTYPFDFNKVFKTSLLKEHLHFYKEFKNNNSRFTLSFAYLPFFFAKTYVTYNQKLITINYSNVKQFNPISLNREWTQLFKLNKKQKNRFTQELGYAKIYHQLIFMYSMVGVSKNKVLLEKMNKLYLKTIKEELNDFFVTNKYILLKNKETAALIKNNSPKKLSKFFKVLNEKK